MTFFVFFPLKDYQAKSVRQLF